MALRIFFRIHVRICAGVRTARKHGIADTRHSMFVECQNEIQQTISYAIDAGPYLILLPVPLTVLKRTAAILGTYLEDAAAAKAAEAVLTTLGKYEITEEGERILANAA